MSPTKPPFRGRRFRTPGLWALGYNFKGEIKTLENFFEKSFPSLSKNLS
jgi:hypothetical protein